MCQLVQTASLADRKAREGTEEGATREGCSYLRCPFRRYEGPSLDGLQPSVRQSVDELDLGSNRYALLLVL
jgi:hypothetical protein